MTPYDELPGDLLAELADAGLDPRAVHDLIVRALEEDLPGGADDTTSTATVPPEATGTADVGAREPGTVAGLGIAALVFHVVAGDAVQVTGRVPDGTRVAAGDSVLTVTGPLRGLLTAERTALNLACHLSGVATATAAWVEALAGTRARVLDTRKTLPGLRALQKYAVRCGGGVNHRFGLADMAMVKDNHVIAAGGVVPALEALRAAYPGLPVEVEVTDLDHSAGPARRGLRADPARQHDDPDHGRGRGDPRPAPRGRRGDARGVRWPHPGARPRGRRDRRRLHLGGCADPLGHRLRPRARPARGPAVSLLAADIGNAHTTIGLLESAGGDAPADVVAHWRVATDPHRTADEWSVLLHGLLGPGAEVDGIVVCSSVPAVLHEWREMLERHFGGVPHVVVEPGVRTGVPVLTDNPREVGSDRIVNALAAARFYGGPAIVVDFGGTATTFDVVNAAGQYVGGAIVPGIEISLEALGRRGAQLRKVEPPAPAR